MKEEKKEYNGQPYERPTLQEWGTVADLTAVGPSGGGGDILGGSVNEQGCAGGGGMMAAGGAACKVSF